MQQRRPPRAKVMRPAQNNRLIMGRIVQKFGGTSVADLDRIRAVAQRVKAEVDAGNQVAVVVSAMSGTTNQLVEWATDIGPVHDAREYDVICLLYTSPSPRDKRQSRMPSSA